MTTNHTPGPWHVDTYCGKVAVLAEGSAVVATCGNDSANAAHIVRCVNERDELLAALHWAESALSARLPNSTALIEVRAAIRKATGACAVSRTLTLETLRAKHACAEQVKRFKATFGESVEITEALCASVATQFDFNWVAENLLSPAALAEYQRVTAPALAEYERVKAPALAEYQRVVAPALTEYQRVTAPPRAEYERVTGPALAEYQRVKAQVWAIRYINDK